MIEIRIHGRGGQGAVTTGQILAIAAFNDGMYSQTFPKFGVERRGAPVEAFVRIDEEKINLRSGIYNPNIVIVLDASLMNTIDVTKGMPKDGMLIVNTNKNPKNKFKTYTVDATGIAMEVMNKPIVNTAMLGAFAKITGIVTLNSLKKAIDEKFSNDLGYLNKKTTEKVFHST